MRALLASGFLQGEGGDDLYNGLDYNSTENILESEFPVSQGSCWETGSLQTDKL